MIRRLLLGGFCWLALSLALGAEDQPWPGRYKLWFSGDAEWHQCAWEITALTDEEMEGTVEVDLGLGPEGREPNPDEKLHKIAFKARRAPEQKAYVAEVLVGSVQPRVYRFECYPIEAGKSLAGVVTIGNQRNGILIRRD